MGKDSNKNRLIRRLVQLFFFILVGLIAVNHKLSETGQGFAFISNASLHAICPFGGVVSIYQLATTGTFVQKIHESAFVMMGILAFMSIAFGAVFCGWVCPLGTVQEWIGKLGKKLAGKRYNRVIPHKVDRYLRYVRYLVLAWVIYITAVTGKLLFSDIDPFHAMYLFWSGEVGLQALILLGVILIVSLVVERPWCKYACPLGAVIGIFNSFRLFGITRKESSCISCGRCSSACPMNINVMGGKRIKDHQCISCLECTSEMSCPVADTVEFTLKGGGRNEVKA
ncbi:MAG: 4Fe-4S binding protein [Pseudomonadota bacterium]